MRAVVVWCLLSATVCAAGEEFRLNIPRARFVLSWDDAALQEFQISASFRDAESQSSTIFSGLVMAEQDESAPGDMRLVTPPKLRVEAPIVLTRGSNYTPIPLIRLVDVDSTTYLRTVSNIHTSQLGGDAALWLVGCTAEEGRESGTTVIYSEGIYLSPTAAARLGIPQASQRALGNCTIVFTPDMTGRTEPRQSQPMLDPDESYGGVASVGPDMQFCQLFDLAQFARSGSTVGLAESTTSWNVGDAPLDWYGLPDTSHPFIVQNLYRLKDDRLEQIGQSWVKHGYCGVDGQQCATTCTVDFNCDLLGVGCTDTYSAALNADQNSMGPRYEVNPWTGAWAYPGSHLSQGFHSHGSIDHMLQAKDTDLDPAQNVGAQYFAEGYYVCPGEVNSMNSASWKPVTPVGTPGGTWTFTMTDRFVPPSIGFAVDAWGGATQTVLAQEVPPIKLSSPDGRCILAAKATPLGGGRWRYEYALLNVDMDRQVGSISVAVSNATAPTDFGSHEAESHEESVNAPGGAVIANTPWSVLPTANLVTWSTTNNPLRWGTLNNFWMESMASPGSATVTLGLFKSGSPTSVTGQTIGPVSIIDCNANSIDDACDISCGAPAGPCDVPNCGMSTDDDRNGVPDECDPPIPTMSEWGLIVLGLLTLGAGSMLIRRRAKYDGLLAAGGE